MVERLLISIVAENSVISDSFHVSPDCRLYLLLQGKHLSQLPLPWEFSIHTAYCLRQIKNSDNNMGQAEINIIVGVQNTSIQVSWLTRQDIRHKLVKGHVIVYSLFVCLFFNLVLLCFLQKAKTVQTIVRCWLFELTLKDCVILYLFMELW